MRKGAETVSSIESPSLSFIVAAYNMEPYLPRCLDSLVFQTRRDVEVVVVDDGSTDSTRAIVDEYARRFPGMVVAIGKENGGPSSARKCGFERSHAPYVSFVDADDWVHPSMAERFLAEVEQGADFVYAPHVSVREGDRDVGEPSFAVEEPTVEAILRRGNNTYWGKLWSRRLLEERASFPDVKHEDVAEVPALISWVEHPAVVSEPLYFYNKANAVSQTTVLDWEGRDDLFKADCMCWERLNPAHADAFRVKLAVRLGWNLRYPETFDRAVEYARWAWSSFELEGVFDELTPRQQELLRFALGCGEPSIPARLILDGFPGSRERYDEEALKQLAFCGDCDVVWMDGETAASAGLDPEAEDEEELAAYLACREIHERGGFYLSSDVVVSEPLVPLRFHTACFVRKDAVSFSHDFFCGAPGSSAFAAVAHACEEASSSGALDVSSAIASVLVSRFGVHLERGGCDGREGVHVFDSPWLYAPVREAASPFSYGYVRAGEAFGVRSFEVLADLYGMRTEEVAGQKRRMRAQKETIARLKQSRERLKEDCDELRAERDGLRDERNELKRQRNELKEERRGLKEERRELKEERDRLKGELRDLEKFGGKIRWWWRRLRER